MKKKSIILLSGGLDSVVLLGAFKEEYGIEYALTFDYGQITAENEINASKIICEYYKIKHQIIKLDWLKKWTTSSLVSGNNIPTENLKTKESAKSVWVPNRNGLFLNIAGCLADAMNYKYILFGANKDEGNTFPDNTEEFRKRVTDEFEYSTQTKVVVSAPLINYTKDDIVKIALEDKIPLEYIRSCYSSTSAKHCGKCESCIHLKSALEHNRADKYIKLLFG